jgi:uncharacterized tellurite resistance protein B-like protein
MIERLMAFFSALPGESSEQGFAADDPRLAAAALMFHVIEADGQLGLVERRRLEEVLSETYGLNDDELGRLVSAAERADQESVDLHAFTTVIKHDLDQPARVHFVELLWEMVYADDEVHELEDNLVWRIAELIGVSTRERVAMKHAVAARRK